MHHLKTFLLNVDTFNYLKEKYLRMASIAQVATVGLSPWFVADPGKPPNETGKKPVDRLEIACSSEQPTWSGWSVIIQPFLHTTSQIRSNQTSTTDPYTRV